MTSNPAPLDATDTLARTELWRVVPFAQNYEASSLGRIRRGSPGNAKTHVGKILRFTKHSFGYDRVGLTINGKKRHYEVHRVILLTFVGPPPLPKWEGCHLDGNPTNCLVSNLIWAPHVVNEAHKKGHGTAPIGQKNAAAKLNDDAVRAMRNRYAELGSLTKTAAEFGVAFQTVSKIVNRKAWSHVPA